MPQNDHDPRLSITLPEPPIDEWERQGAFSELSRVARDLEKQDADGVTGRLGRLTQSQRNAIADALERILELGD
jgi:hypothetical protein